MKKLFLKKTLALALACIMCVCLFACAEDGAQTDTSALEGTSGIAESLFVGTQDTEGNTPDTENGGAQTQTPNKGENGENGENKEEPPVPEDEHPNIKLTQTLDSVPDVVGGNIKNVILIIGDGMGLNHVKAAELATARQFEFDDWARVNVNTDSVKSDGKSLVLTDSAAAGTAMATGKLTVNGYIGKDHKGNDTNTLLDHAAVTYKKATGIVTTDYLHGATPSSFSGHSMSRNNVESITVSQIVSGVNFLCGSVAPECTARRAEIERTGYKYCESYANRRSVLGSKYAYCQFDMNGADAPVKLKDATMLALEFLSSDPDGFVLVIEQAHVDKYSHSNDFANMVKCASDLDETVDTVLEWIGDRTDTAVFVTADHETGGLKVGEGSKSYTAPDGSKVSYAWSTGSHTNSDVGLFVYGVAPEYEKLATYSSATRVKNTDIFGLVLGAIRNE